MHFKHKFISTASKSLFTVSLFYTLKNKMSPNNGTLPNGVLRPKPLNKPFAFWSFTNLAFLIPHTEHFDCIINLFCFVFSEILV